MRSARWLVVLVAMLAGSGAARAASFDCKLASTPQEKAICATPELSAQDERLNAAYKQLLHSVSPNAAALVRPDEAAWLRFVAKVCRANKAQTATDLATCMLPLYKDHTKFLSHPPLVRGDMKFFRRSISVAAADKEQTSFGSADFPGFGTVQAEFFQADSDAPQWAAWNTAVYQQAAALAGADAKPPAFDDSLAQDQDATLTATIEHVDGDRVSVRLENDFMGHGAAHPGEAWMHFHWLLSQQRELKATDMFTETSGWQKFVATRCYYAVKKQFEKDGFDYLYDKTPLSKGMLDTVSSPRNWKLNATGLEVEFPEYSISPRVAPPENVVVPWAALTPYLAAGFKPSK